MSKIYKKLIGVSLVLGSMFSVYSAVSAMVNEGDNLETIPVCDEKKKDTEKEEEDKEDSKACISELVGAGVKAVADEVKDKVEEHKEDAQEEAEKMKDQFSNFVDKINDNMDKITEKQDEASEKADQHQEAMDKLKEKEDQINEKEKAIKIKNDLSKDFDAFLKTQQDAIEKMKEKVNNTVSENSDSSKETKESKG